MITIENNQDPNINHDPKVGDFYCRVDNSESLYIVTRQYNSDIAQYQYGLVNLTSGLIYSYPSRFITDIFGDHSSKFYPITKDIKITIG